MAPKIKNSPSFSRDGRTDEQYIAALELSNASLASENRRLAKVVQMKDRELAKLRNRK